MQKYSQSFLIPIYAALLTCMILFLPGTANVSLAQSASGEVSADEVNRVASELWCPLCSGVRLDACELKACEQMREEIAIKLEAGEDAGSIKQYFVTRYGEQVLGAPRRQGWGWLAWLLPPTVIGIAGVLLFLRGREWIRPAVSEKSTTTKAAGVGQIHPGSNLPSQKATDQYETKLDEELARYE